MTRDEMRANWPANRARTHDHTWKEPWAWELRFCTSCGLMEFYNADIYHDALGWKRCERTSLLRQREAGMRIEKATGLEEYYLV